MTLQETIERNRVISARNQKMAQLNAEINDLGRKRDELMAALGISLYDEVKSTPALRIPRETLVASVENLDSRVEGLRREINQVENDALSAAQLASGITCPVCNKVVNGSSRFCISCGADLEQYKAAKPGLGAGGAPTFCVGCGATLAPGAKFCVSCGSAQGGA